MILRKYSEAALWGLVTGVLFATSYPPFPAWALFFAFAPMWVFWYKAQDLRQVFAAGFVAQFVMHIIGFNWVAYTATEYGHLPWIVSILILIGFCSFAGLNVPIAGLLASYIQKRWPLKPLGFFLLVAVFSSLWERLYPMIFPWNAGYPLLCSHMHSAQLAEFLGFNLLGTLVYFANCAFAVAYLKFPQKKWSRPLYVFVVGLFVAEMLGTWALNRLPVDDGKIKALLIQPNIGNYDKFVAERGNGYQEPVVRKDLDITERGFNQALAAGLKPDVIIWPETAYPASLDPYEKDTFYMSELSKFVKRLNTPILAGAYSEDPGNDKDRKYYNGVFLITPKEEYQDGYRKHLLLAFGEYFPGAEYFPFLKKLIPEISDFGRGAGPMVFKVAETDLSPLICYEGLDTDYVRKTVEKNGHILVNVTNDSWFGTNFEPHQHLIMTTARTVEYRRPMIRVTNTGITTVANSKGELLFQGPQNVEWSKLAEVPYSTRATQTVFFSIEPYIDAILISLAMVIFFVGRVNRAKQRT